MVKSYFLSNIRKDYVIENIVEDISVLPNISEVNYYEFQEKIKVTYKKGADVKGSFEDIQDIVASYDREMIISENVELGSETSNKVNLILGIMGLIIFVVSYFIFTKHILQKEEIIGGFKVPISDIFYLIAIILEAHIIVRKTFNSLVNKKKLEPEFLILLAILGCILLNNHVDAFIVSVIYIIGDYIVNRVSLSGKKGVAEILNDNDSTVVNKVFGDIVSSVPIKDVSIGDIIVVRPGEIVPLEGVVVGGKSALDLSDISTDSYVEDVKGGSAVRSGAKNLDKSLKIKVTNTFDEGLARTLILRTEEALEKKSPMQKSIEKIGRLYLPIILTLAVFVMLFGGPLTGSGWFDEIYILKGVIILAIACPWAMIISAPLAYNYALGLFKKFGVIVKKASSVDNIGRLKTMYFTKTGILSTGEYEIVDIIPGKNFKEEHLKTFASIVEAKSRNFVGKSISNQLKAKVPMEEIEGFRELPSRGVKCKYKGHELIGGKEEFLLEEGIVAEVYEDIMTVHFGVDGNYAGAITLKEKSKEGVNAIIEKIKNIPLSKVGVLTGGRKTDAKFVLSEVPLTVIYGDLSKDEKVDKIKREKAALKNNTVGYFGDTISDGPLMATSDVSFAFYRDGMDKVTETADVIIMKEDLNLVYESIKLGKRTYQIVRQSIFLSFFVKAILIGLALFRDVQDSYIIIAISVDIAFALLTLLNTFRIPYRFRDILKKKDK